MFHFKFAVSVALSCIFCGTQAALKTYYVHDLCYYKVAASIYLGETHSGFLTALSTSHLSCTIELKPYVRNSIVLSIYRYELNEGDQLIIEDYDNYKTALIGFGDFSDERKSIISDGPLTIYYYRNNTQHSGRIHFQFTFTHATRMPCGYNEYLCRNRRCISRNLVCDGHNHCGDRSDQDNCEPQTDESFNKLSKVSASRSTLIVVVIALSVLSLVVFVSLLTCIILVFVRRRKIQTPAIPTVEAEVPVGNVPSHPNPAQSTPSVFGQIRRSFCNKQCSKQKVKKTDEQKADNYEVTSIYPQIPSAPEVSEIENTNFLPSQ